MNTRSKEYYLIGSDITLAYLKNRKDLNGKIGFVFEFIQDKHRFGVRLIDGTEISVKECNLLKIRRFCGSGETKYKIDLLRDSLEYKNFNKAMEIFKLLEHNNYEISEYEIFTKANLIAEMRVKYREIPLVLTKLALIVEKLIKTCKFTDLNVRLRVLLFQLDPKSEKYIKLVEECIVDHHGFFPIIVASMFNFYKDDDTRLFALYKSAINMIENGTYNAHMYVPNLYYAALSSSSSPGKFISDDLVSLLTVMIPFCGS
jgi:hypothetical protein